mmetsp:Transcript_6296/g.6210  ORF Transcript_6296/g.6210 Transcript_6296/m.6210 type:complete len:136 (-) Transcript_6296:24-431(-)
MSDEEKKLAELEGLAKRKLIAEFAVENAEVVKRRREKTFQARNNKDNGETNTDKKSFDRKRRRDDKDDGKGKGDSRKNDKRARKGSNKKGNMNKGVKPAPNGNQPESKATQNKSGLSDNVKNIIGIKRKRRKGKN